MFGVSKGCTACQGAKARPPMAWRKRGQAIATEGNTTEDGESNRKTYENYGGVMGFMVGFIARVYDREVDDIYPLVI